MVRKLRMVSLLGDEVLAEWESETVSAEELELIEREFERRTRQGFWAVDITDKHDVVVKKFDKEKEILLIPKVSGGASN